MIRDDEMIPDWLRSLQRAPARVPEGATRPSLLLFDAEHRAIARPEAWRSRRGELRRAWERFLGVIDVPRPPDRFTVVEEDRPAGVIRQLVRYESEPGLPVEAYLLRPDRPGRGRPGAVVLHSTVDGTIRQPAGLEGPEEKHIGLKLARLGYVAICPRCFLWQYRRGNKFESAVDWLRARHPGITGMAKMLHDARRSVDVLAAIDEVDPGRIGAIGHSLGGKEVLYLSAFDDRIRASVSSEGGIGLTYSNWDAPWYLGEAIRRPGFPLDHGQVLALAAPRAFLLIGGDSADGDRSWPYIEATIPLWDLLGDGRAVGMFDHHRGHAFPPEAVAMAGSWLGRFLSGRGGPITGPARTGSAP